MPTSSPTGPRNTAPTFYSASEGKSPDAARVAALSAKCGLVLDPWQEDVLHGALARDAVTTKWVTPRVGVWVPRQNGKGAIIEAIELAFLMGLWGDADLLIHSAHEFKTAQNAFQRVVSYFDSVPALAKARAQKRVRIGTATAREYVTVTGPDDVTRTIRFFARSRKSGRGFSADLLILDEAQELSDEVWAAILPTVSARPNPQIWLFGTPPSPEMNGEVFLRFRDAAHAGRDDRLAWFEWSASPDDDFSDVALWARVNPALGIRISEETVRDEYNSMDDDTFGRERLGVADGSGTAQVIPSDTWEALVSETDPTGRVAFAVDVSPDRSRASIGVAGYIDGERVMVQTIDNRKGTGWVAPRLKELTTRWRYSVVVLDSRGPAASLLPSLKRARVRRVRQMAASDMAQACGAFYDAAMEGRLAHPDQPILNDALASAKKRDLGDAWAWHRKSSTNDITPLVAVTLAHLALIRKPPADDERSGASVVIL